MDVNVDHLINKICEEVMDTAKFEDIPRAIHTWLRVAYDKGFYYGEKNLADKIKDKLPGMIDQFRTRVL